MRPMSEGSAPLPGCFISARATPRGLLTLLGVGESNPYVIPKSRYSARSCVEQNITLFLADYLVFLGVFLIVACVYRPLFFVILALIVAGSYWILGEVDRVHSYRDLSAAYASRTRRRSSSSGFQTSVAPYSASLGTWKEDQLDSRLTARSSGAISSAAAAYLGESASTATSALSHMRPELPLLLPKPPLSVAAAEALSPFVPAGPRAAVVVTIALALPFVLLTGGIPLILAVLLWGIIAAAHVCTRASSAALMSHVQPAGPGRPLSPPQRLLLIVTGALVSDTVPQAALSAAYEGSPSISAAAAAAAGGTAQADSLGGAGKSADVDDDDDEEAGDRGEARETNAARRFGSSVAALAGSGTTGSVLVPPMASPALALSAASASARSTMRWSDGSSDIETGLNRVQEPFSAAGGSAYRSNHLNSHSHAPAPGPAPASAPAPAHAHAPASVPGASASHTPAPMAHTQSQHEHQPRLLPQPQMPMASVARPPPFQPPFGAPLQAPQPPQMPSLPQPPARFPMPPLHHSQQPHQQMPKPMAHPFAPTFDAQPHAPAPAVGTGVGTGSGRGPVPSTSVHGPK